MLSLEERERREEKKMTTGNKRSINRRQAPHQEEKDVEVLLRTWRKAGF